MRINIKLDHSEKRKLENARKILLEYSRLYGEMAKNKEGMFFDEAGTAAAAILKILENQE